MENEFSPFFTLILGFSSILYFLKERIADRCKWLLRIKYSFLAAAVIIFEVALAVLKTIIQYDVWKQGELSQFLLPPHQPINYFISYCW